MTPFDRNRNARMATYILAALAAGDALSSRTPPVDPLPPTPRRRRPQPMQRLPHQGKQECARRVRLLAIGAVSPGWVRS